MESKKKDNRKSVTLYLKILTCLVLVLAFFPMCLVSCGGETAKVTMEQVIVGYEYKGSPVADPAPIYILYFILLIVLTIIVFRKSYSESKKAKITLGCSSACIIFIAVFVSQVEKWAERNGMLMQTTAAYIISLCSLICMDLLSIAILVLEKKSNKKQLSNYGVQYGYANMPNNSISITREWGNKAQKSLGDLKQRATVAKEAWNNAGLDGQKETIYVTTSNDQEVRAKCSKKTQHGPGSFEEVFSDVFNLKQKTDKGKNSPPPIPEEVYNVAVGGKPTGPYNIETLSKMAQSGEINLGTLVWKVGMSNWKTIDEIAELIEVKKHIPPAIKKKKRNFFMDDAVDLDDFLSN